MKDSFDKRRPTKLSQELEQLASSAERGGQTDPQGGGPEDPEALVQVLVELIRGASSEGVEAEIRNAGGRVLAGTRDLISAALPAGALRRVADHTEVLFVGIPLR